jgi:hypothetical protein
VGRERSEDRVSSWGSTGQRHTTTRTSASVTTTASPDHYHSSRSVPSSSSSPSSSGARLSSGRRRPASSLSPSHPLTTPLHPTPSSAAVAADVALRERVFFYMCDQLRRLVDDLYNLCDESGVEEMCSEIVGILMGANKDFENLEDRIHKFDEHDQHVDEGLKPPSMVWDVRKVVSSGVDIQEVGSGENGVDDVGMIEGKDEGIHVEDVSGDEEDEIHDDDDDDSDGGDGDDGDDGSDGSDDDDDDVDEGCEDKTKRDRVAVGTRSTPDRAGDHSRKSCVEIHVSDATTIMGSPKRIGGKAKGSQVAYRVVGGKRVPISDFDRDLSPSYCISFPTPTPIHPLLVYKSVYLCHCFFDLTRFSPALMISVWLRSDLHSMTLAEKKKLRERLSSPDRGQKKTPSEVQEAMNARLSAAEKKRDQQKKDKIEKLRQSSVRVKEVTGRNEEKRIRKQLFAEERLAHADEKRDIAIRGIREKALDELTKAEEVVFIRTLQEDIDRQEKEEKMVRRVQQSEGRREESKRELLRKTEEHRGLEGRVGIRKKRLEEERIKTLEEKEVTREEKKKRVIDERHRVSAAQRAKHEEKVYTHLLNFRLLFSFARVE